MKRLFFLLLCAAFTLPMAAQTTKTAQQPSAQLAPDDAAARTTVQQLTAKYGLNADQAKQMYGIQARKQRNLAQIEPLQASNQALYRAKLESVQHGTSASIRRLLQSKAQLDIFQKTQADLRSQRGKIRKEMSAQGAAKEAIELAVLAIYAE